MIVENIINIKTNPSNYKHYINKGYYIEKCGCNINVNIQDLPPKSHVKIKCKCEKCDIISEVDYSNYIVQTKNSYYVCSDCWKYKLKETIYNKYGVNNIRHLPGINEKIINTNLERYGVKSLLEKKEVRDKIIQYYGVDNISKSTYIKEIKRIKSNNKYNKNTPLQDPTIIKTIREKHIISGRWHDYNINDFSDYRSKVNYLTKKNKIELFKIWNGFDYYDGEYILDNLNLDKNHNNYPSVDHKIPALFGFLNNIDVIDISNINNLCITKRYINSSKFTKSEMDFINGLSII